MTVSQITPSQQALFYNILAKDMYSTNTGTSSLLSGYSNSTDSSPYLSMALYNNSSSNLLNSFMNTFINYIMQMFMTMFMQNFMNQSQTVQNVANSDTSNIVVDTNPVAETQEAKEPRDVVKLTSDNLESDLRNQKGTSYVIVCDSGCGRCIKFSPVLEAVNNNLNTSATFYSLKYSDEKQLEQTLKKESGADVSKSAGFPIIIKCVDGIAKEFYSYADVKDIYTDEEKMTEWFKDKL